MTDPAQQAAARIALGAAADDWACDVGELIVREVVRLRRRGTKIPFYSVTIERGATGTRIYFQVSDAGKRVERDWPR